MSVVPVAQRMTVEEYAERYPETSTGERTELIDGEVVVSHPRALHQVVSLEVAIALRQWTRGAAGRGFAVQAIDVRLGDHDAYCPDVLWYRPNRKLPPLDAWPYPTPDLAVEVRSPSTWRYDIGAKKRRYEQTGLAELWLIDTAAQEVIAFRRSSSSSDAFDVSLEAAVGDVLASPLLPGFALAVGKLFEAGP
ncbi:MAG: Uma2 family endonuclease [Actinomycetota bacterium]|nr:Uma2 family endonuclease [Actinomycetota bacterium]